MSRRARLPQMDADQHQRRGPASRFLESAKDRLLEFGRGRANGHIGDKIVEDPSDPAITPDEPRETEQVTTGENPNAEPTPKRTLTRQTDETNRRITILCATAISAKERPLTTPELVKILHRAGVGPTASTGQGRFIRIEKALRSPIAAEAGIVEIKGRFPPPGQGRPASRAWTLRRQEETNTRP